MHRWASGKTIVALHLTVSTNHVRRMGQSLKRTEWQYLENDYWLRCMTAFVAAILTLISPSIFKILRGFLTYALRLEIRWRESRRSRAPQDLDLEDERTSLLPSGQLTTREIQQDGESEHPSSPSQSKDQQPDPPVHSETSSIQVPNLDGRSTNSVVDGKQADTASNRTPHQNGKSKSSVLDDHQHSETGSDMDIQQTSPTPTTGNNIPLQTPAANTEADPVQLLRHSESGRVIVLDLIQKLDKPNIASLIIATAVIGACVALSITGAFTPDIASNKVGLSSSEHCGIWQLDSEVGTEPVDRDKEDRASEYARNCYGTQQTANTLSCKLFYNQSIAFNTYRDQRFPSPRQKSVQGGCTQQYLLIPALLMLVSLASMLRQHINSVEEQPALHSIYRSRMLHV